MSELAKEAEYESKLRAIVEETKSVKRATKETQDKLKEVERTNQDQHRAIIDCDERARKIQAMINIGQKKGATTGMALLKVSQPTRRWSEVEAVEESEESLEQALKMTQDQAREEEKKLRRQLMDIDTQTEKMR